MPADEPWLFRPVRIVNVGNELFLNEQQEALSAPASRMFLDLRGRKIPESGVLVDILDRDDDEIWDAFILDE